MDVSTVRPKVAQLAFQLLGRSVHPELFQIYKTQRFENSNYSATIQLTVDGHLISWRTGTKTLTEIASSTRQQLPSGERCLSAQLLSRDKNSLSPAPGLKYQYEYEVERVSADLFWMIQKQLSEGNDGDALIHVFNSSGRIPIGGMSFVHVDTRLKSLHVQAIHTFPDDMALLKTESTFSIS